MDPPSPSITPNVASNSTTGTIEAVIKETRICRHQLKRSNSCLLSTGASQGDIQVTRTDSSEDGTEVNVTLSGLSNLPEGDRDLVITDSDTGLQTTKKGAFFPSSIGIQMEVNQGGPLSCSSSVPCGCTTQYRSPGQAGL